MEVPGKRQTSDQGQRACMVSSKDSGAFCKPCSASGKILETKRFCQNCQEYLCITCIKHHLKASLSKHHTIVDTANMPTNIAVQTIKQLCTESCEEHMPEVIIYFCRNHDTVGCGKCMITDHMMCDIDFISDIVGAFINGKEQEAIFAKVDMLQVEVESKLLMLENHKHACTEEYDAVFQEIKTFRKELDDYLDKMEKSLLKKSNYLREKNATVIIENEDLLKTVKSELDDINDCLKAESREIGDLFVKAKQTNGRLKQVEHDLRRGAEFTLTHYMFVSNADLDAITSGSYGLGKLIKHFSLLYPSQVVNIDNKPVYSGAINVKSKSDNFTVSTSSILSLSPDTLLCADYQNSSLKVVDTKQNCISSLKLLKSWPWDLTFASTYMIAVTLPDIKKIQIVSNRGNKLTSVREINVNGECRGIAYHNNIFVVSFVEPSKLQVLTLNGEVIHDIKPDFLDYPVYTDISSCGNYFYVSDAGKNRVTKLSFDGKLIATYDDKSLKNLRSITVCKDGSVFVCNSGDNTLHFISQDCRKIRILPIEEEKLNELHCVCFSETTSILYLGDYARNSLLVYKMV